MLKRLIQPFNLPAAKTHLEPPTELFSRAIRTELLQLLIVTTIIAQAGT